VWLDYKANEIAILYCKVSILKRTKKGHAKNGSEFYLPVACRKAKAVISLLNLSPYYWLIISKSYIYYKNTRENSNNLILSILANKLN